MANELLELRSQNIKSIMQERSKAEGWGHSAITMPAANPRVDELHQKLGVDKAVLVSSPMKIDTTPQAAGDPQGRWTAVDSGPQLDTMQYSMTGETLPGAYNGVRVRGGWPVKRMM